METQIYLSKNIKLSVSYIRVCKTAPAASVGISELADYFEISFLLFE